jgi:hypothetical protein
VATRATWRKSSMKACSCNRRDSSSCARRMDEGGTVAKPIKLQKHGEHIHRVFQEDLLPPGQVHDISPISIFRGAYPLHLCRHPWYAGLLMRLAMPVRLRSRSAFLPCGTRAGRIPPRNKGAPVSMSPGAEDIRRLSLYRQTLLIPLCSHRFACRICRRLREPRRWRCDGSQSCSVWPDRSRSDRADTRCTS